jgi:lipopolysaccharide biosynthesis glycosyltransferase
LNDDTKSKLRSVVERYNSICVFHKVDESKLDGVQFRKKKPLTKAAYYRILLSSIIDKSISKILYLDSDIVVVNNITSIFDLGIDGYALAAVDDGPIATEHRMSLSLPYDAKYFNSGVMFINLDYWRKSDSENQLLKFAKDRKGKVYYHDQDALNVVFCSKWFSLPHKWNKVQLRHVDNFSFITERDKYEFIKHPMIMHYASPLKPWLKFPVIPYKHLYCRYLKQTPWKDAKPVIYRDYIFACRLFFVCFVIPFLRAMHLYFLCYPIVLLIRRKHLKKL